MRARLLGIIWAACAAALLGVLAVAATGGSAPSGALVGVLVGIPIAITLFVDLRRRLSRRDRRVISLPLELAHEPTAVRDRAVAPAPAPTTRDSRRLARGRKSSRKQEASTGLDARIRDVDLEHVSAICGGLGDRKLDWLRSNGFGVPWLDGQARPAIELAPLVAQLVEVPFSPEIKRTLLALSNAIESFAAFYEDNTAVDPLVRGEDWRFFEWDDPDSGGDDRERDDATWGGRAVRLHELASQVADAYEDFRTAVASDPDVQRVVSGRV